MSDERKPVWKTCLLVGCGVMLLVAAAGGVLVAMNWETISKTYDEAKATFSELMGARAAVMEHTGEKEVGMTVNTDLGTKATTLRIEFTSARVFGTDASEPAQREKALAIAVIARDALSADGRPARYEVTSKDSVGVGVTISRTRRFVFAASELPPVAAPIAPR